MGGTERHCAQLAKNLDTSKYHLHLLTFNKNGPLLKDILSAGIPVTEVTITRALYTPQSLRQIFRLAHFIKRNNFSIVQTFGIYSNIPGILAAKLARVPIIIGGKREMNEIWPRKKVAVEMMLLKTCDKVIVNAERVKNYLTQNEGIEEKQVEVIYNGIDWQKYDGIRIKDYASKLNTVGMVANYRPPKDHSTFLKAAAQVLEKTTNVRFVLVGSGATETEMKDLASTLEIQKNVQFCGAKFGNELLDIFRRFTITVLASWTEGFPNVLLESMALGVPVIANPSGGVPELIDDNRTGYLFPPMRHDILAEKIVYLIDNKNVATSVAGHAFNRVKKRFSFDTMVKQHEILYESLISDGFV